MNLTETLKDPEETNHHNVLFIEHKHLQVVYVYDLEYL